MRTKKQDELFIYMSERGATFGDMGWDEPYRIKVHKGQFWVQENKDDGFATVWTSGCICVEPYADYALKDSPFNRNTDKVEMN